MDLPGPITVNAAIQTDPGLINPLVWNGAISQDFLYILCPPIEPLKNKAKRTNKTSTARVITSDECYGDALREAQEKEQKQRDAEEKRTRTQEAKKQKAEEKKLKAQEKRQKANERKQKANERRQKAKQRKQRMVYISESESENACDLNDTIGYEDDIVDVEDNIVCRECGLRDPDDNNNITDWTSCELCSAWCHNICSGLFISECVYICSKCHNL